MSKVGKNRFHSDGRSEKYDRIHNPPFVVQCCLNTEFLSLSLSIYIYVSLSVCL